MSNSCDSKPSQLIREEGGIFARLMPREEYFEKALYTFDIGQNDLGAGFFSMSVEEVNASVPDMINAFSTNVEVCDSRTISV